MARTSETAPYRVLTDELTKDIRVGHAAVAPVIGEGPAITADPNSTPETYVPDYSAIDRKTTGGAQLPVINGKDDGKEIERYQPRMGEVTLPGVTAQEAFTLPEHTSPELQ